jgi:hypothetical protein
MEEFFANFREKSLNALEYIRNKGHFAYIKTQFTFYHALNALHRKGQQWFPNKHESVPGEINLDNDLEHNLENSDTQHLIHF